MYGIYRVLELGIKSRSDRAMLRQNTIQYGSGSQLQAICPQGTLGSV